MERMDPDRSNISNVLIFSRYYYCFFLRISVESGSLKILASRPYLPAGRYLVSAWAGRQRFPIFSVGHPAHLWSTATDCDLLPDRQHLLSVGSETGQQNRDRRDTLVGYWILMRWVPVPGFGLPGRDIPLFDPTRNLAAYIDRHIFPGWLYRGVRDPEGLLSTLPALETTLLGMLTGMWLRSKRSPALKAWGMLVAGVFGISLGLLWGHWFPINKNLWTSSYVLFAAGCALVALSLCYWAIDIKNWKNGWTYIWLVFGMSAITVYVFSELLASTLYSIHVHMGTAKVSLSWYLFTYCFAEVPSHHLASLAYSISIVAVCFVPVAVLYRKRIFLKI
jgi:hypothetical protein